MSANKEDKKDKSGIEFVVKILKHFDKKKMEKLIYNIECIDEKLAASIKHEREASENSDKKILFVKEISAGNSQKSSEVEDPQLNESEVDPHIQKKIVQKRGFWV
jgi:hypothetical protein